MAVVVILWLYCAQYAYALVTDLNPLPEVILKAHLTQCISTVNFKLNSNEKYGLRMGPQFGLHLYELFATLPKQLFHIRTEWNATHCHYCQNGIIFSVVENYGNDF